MSPFGVGIVAGTKASHAAAGLVRTAHPKPSGAVTVFAVALAVADGAGVAGALLVGGAVLSGQLSIGWSNDRIDAVRDAATARTDKPLATGGIAPALVGRAAAIALPVCAALSLWYGLAAGVAHLAGVGCGWAYNAGLKRTVWSPVPYAVAFGLLPVFVALGTRPGPTAMSGWPPAWQPAAAALLGVGAHLANALPDIAADRAAGVPGLPAMLGPAATRALLPVPLLAASAVLVFVPTGTPGTAGWAALAVTAALAAYAALVPATRSRAAFTATITIAALNVALFLLRAFHPP